MSERVEPPGEGWLDGAHEGPKLTLQVQPAVPDTGGTAIEQILRGVQEHAREYATRFGSWPDMIVLVGHQLWSRILRQEIQRAPWSMMVHRQPGDPRGGAQDGALVLAAPGGKEARVYATDGAVGLREWRIVQDSGVGGAIE